MGKRDWVGCCLQGGLGGVSEKATPELRPRTVGAPAKSPERRLECRQTPAWLDRGKHAA